LILVEGLPGCGKSTTAQFLALRLQRAGRRARWHYEEESPHPVVAPYTGSTWQGYFEDRFARWARFAAQVRASDEVRILESTLLQTPILTTLQGNVPSDVISMFLRRLQEMLVPLEPWLVYLYHPRPEEAWRSIAARRGSGWENHHTVRLQHSPFAAARDKIGVALKLTYWREHGDLVERTVAASPLRTTVLDVTDGDWTWRERALLGHLGLDPADAGGPGSAGELRRYEGRYRGGPTGAKEFAVVLREDWLVLEGLLWPRNPLLPAGAGVFDARSWPFEFRFEDDGDGVVRGLHVAGPALGWGRVDGFYARV
jgi:hypothetical protein